LLAATLYQGNPDRNHKLWNIVSTERYILHMQVLLIDDVLSLNNSRFGDFVDRIYPIELEIKDTTDTDTSASYLDLHLEIDSEGRFRMKLYDKCRVNLVTNPAISHERGKDRETITTSGTYRGHL
jgi:hypothetical protein